MKKIISALLFAGLSAAASVSMAAGVAVPNGTPITEDDCELLRDRVTINLSSQVVMSYNCNVADNVISVAACHPGGSQKPMTVDCTAIGSNPDGTPIWNDESCPAVATDPATTVEIEGRRVFFGSSTGGTIGAGNLNADVCTTGAVNAQAIMQ